MLRPKEKTHIQVSRTFADHFFDSLAVFPPTLRRVIDTRNGNDAHLNGRAKRFLEEETTAAGMHGFRQNIDRFGRWKSVTWIVEPMPQGERGAIGAVAI